MSTTSPAIDTLATAEVIDDLLARITHSNALEFCSAEQLRMLSVEIIGELAVRAARCVA